MQKGMTQREAKRRIEATAERIKQVLIDIDNKYPHRDRTRLPPRSYEEEKEKAKKALLRMVRRYFWLFPGVN